MSDHDLWVEFFKATIAGCDSSSDKFSNEKTLIDWCVRVADAAVEAERRKRDPKYQAEIYGGRK